MISFFDFGLVGRVKINRRIEGFFIIIFLKSIDLQSKDHWLRKVFDYLCYYGKVVYPCNSIQHNKRSPRIRILILRSTLVSGLDKGLPFAGTLHQIRVEISHQVLCGFVFYIPKAHNDRLSTSLFKSSLQAKYTFT